jgi:hypothetical protein
MNQKVVAIKYIRLKEAAVWGDPISGIRLTRWEKPWAEVPEGTPDTGIRFGIAANRIEVVTSRREAEKTRKVPRPPRLRLTKDRESVEPTGELINDPPYIMLQENREQSIMLEVRKVTDLEFIERALNYETMGTNMGHAPRPRVVEALWSRMNELRKKKGLSVTREQPEILPIV